MKSAHISRKPKPKARSDLGLTLTAKALTTGSGWVGFRGKPRMPGERKLHSPVAICAAAETFPILSPLTCLLARSDRRVRTKGDELLRASLRELFYEQRSRKR